MERLRRAIRWLTPFGIRAPRHQAWAEAQHAASIERAKAERQRLLKQAAAAGAAEREEFDYELAIAVLAESGLSEQQVRDGSMPEESLELVTKRLADHLTGDPPLALHVGNFVGVSLAYLTAALRAHDPRALVVSIDPAMTHRGIEAPDRIALRLLDRFGLTANSMVITGFTRERNMPDDGYVWPDHAAPRAMSAEAAADLLGGHAACENVLPNLARLLPGQFDLALLDGNHEAGYLSAELRDVDVLLRPGGLLVLDDVGDDFWDDLSDLFAELASGDRGYAQLDRDGRVGLLARTPAGDPAR